MEWHGYRIGDRLTGEDVIVGIGPLPQRSQIALYLDYGRGRIEPLAYFKTEVLAARALRMLSMLARADAIK